MHKRSSLGDSTEPVASPVAPGWGGGGLPVTAAEGGGHRAPGTGPVPVPRRGTPTLIAPVAGASLGPPRPDSVSVGVYHPP